MNRQTITDAIIRELGDHRSREDIIRMVCTQTNYKWDEADALIAEIERTNRKKIAKRRFPLLLFLALSTAIGIVSQVDNIITTEGNADVPWMVPHIAVLFPSSVDKLKTLPPGQEVLVSGYISTQNPVFPDNLVAYDRGYYQTHVRGPSTWEVFEEQKPGLLLEPEPGEMVGVSPGYRIINPGSSYDTTQDFVRFSDKGFQPGEQVFVVGTLVTGQDTTLDMPIIHADSMIGGTRAAFLARQFPALLTHLLIWVLDALWVGTGLWLMGMTFKRLYQRFCAWIG